MPFNSRSSLTVSIVLELLAGVALFFAFFSGNSFISFINTLSYLQLDTTLTLASGETAARLTLWGFCIFTGSTANCTALPLSTLATTRPYTALPTPPTLTGTPLQLSTVIGNLPVQTNTIGFLGVLIGLGMVFISAIASVIGVTWRGGRGASRSMAKTIFASTAAATSLLGLGTATCAFAFLLSAALQLREQINVLYGAADQGVVASISIYLFIPIGIAMVLGSGGFILALRASVIGRSLHDDDDSDYDGDDDDGGYYRGGGDVGASGNGAYGASGTAADPYRYTDDSGRIKRGSDPNANAFALASRAGTASGSQVSYGGSSSASLSRQPAAYATTTGRAPHTSWATAAAYDPSLLQQQQQQSSAYPSAAAAAYADTYGQVGGGTAYAGGYAGGGGGYTYGRYAG
ncbi:hypothetical protein HK405_014359 [Cladochytrium tenue]|nr:hypothetical protein HK405_014359 [Cladochytrium tenue]